MTSKGLIRYIVAVIILVIILSIGLPLGGIPRQSIVAPPIAFTQAGANTRGTITKTDTSPTANPFHVGDLDYFAWYTFTAPALPPLGKHTVAPGATETYTGHAQIDQSLYGTLKPGQDVTIKYDPTDPVISGISGTGGGRNGEGQAALLSMWILWDIGILFVAYPLAMLLERVMLRESY